MLHCATGMLRYNTTHGMGRAISKRHANGTIVLDSAMKQGPCQLDSRSADREKGDTPEKNRSGSHEVLTHSHPAANTGSMMSMTKFKI